MSVDEAYRAVPVERVPFEPYRTVMPIEEADFMRDFFALVDEAIVEKVTAQIRLARGEQPRMHYDVLLAKFEALTVPAKLQGVYDLVVSAVREQEASLRDWQTRRTNFDARDPRVSSSHQKLLKAYYELLGLYPNEFQHNRQSFYSHLCALDFI
jgi:hypothetical protein